MLADRIAGVSHLKQEESRMFAQGSPPELDDKKIEATRLGRIVRLAGRFRPVSYSAWAFLPTPPAHRMLAL